MRRVRVDIKVELGQGSGVAVGAQRAAHDDHLAHVLDDPRLLANRHGHVGERRDRDQAAQILRQKGLSKVATLEDRENNQGAVAIAHQGNVAAMVQLRSETDFSGKSDDFVCLTAGPWKIFVRINKDARFPQVDRIIPNPEGATVVAFDDADTNFLTEVLPSLPGEDESQSPVTIDANGSVNVRCGSTGSPRSWG